MSTGVIASQAFVPNKNSGLPLWLDASRLDVILESGGFVSQWNDKGGNDNHAIQAVGANQPVYNLNDINGLNSVDFSVTSTLFFDLTFELVLTDLTLIVIFVNTVAPTADAIIMAHSTLNQQALRFNASIGTFGQLSSFDGSPLSFNLVSSILDIPVLLKADYRAGTNRRLFINGAVVATGSYSGTMTLDRVCRLLSSMVNVGGKIGELIIYDRVLTFTEALDVDNYLNNKWKIGVSFPFAFSEDFSSDFS